MQTESRLAGEYEDKKGFKSNYLPLDYYDLHIDAHTSIVINTKKESSIMVFTLLGEVYIGDELVKEKIAAKLTMGDHVVFKAAHQNAQVLFISSMQLDEPIAWGGPIVMNTKDELQKAFDDLKQGSFLQKDISY